MIVEAIFAVPVAALLAFLVFGNEGARWMRTYLLVPLSIAVIFIVGGWQTLLTAMSFALAAYLILALIKQMGGTGARWGATLYIACVIAIFVFLKDYFGVADWILTESGGELFSRLVSSLGLSFMVFRVIEFGLLNLAAAERAAPLPNALNYIGFCIAFPAFFSGPVTRWRTHQEQLAASPAVFLDLDAFFQNGQRLANGLFVIGVLSQPLIALFAAVNQMLPSLETGQIANFSFLFAFLMLSVFYLLFLYWNFSAFTDVMVASGRLLGLVLPENFNRPFLATNIQDFFARWHMSVTEWFRDLVFTPLVMTLVRQGVRSNTLCAATGFFASFGLLGIWHGRTWPFLLCGAMLGTGALIVQFFKDGPRKKLNKKLKSRPKTKGAFGLFARSLTLVYIGVSVLALWLGTKSLIIVLQGVWSPAFLPALLFAVAATAIVIGCIDLIWSFLSMRLANVGDAVQSRLTGNWAQSGTICLKIAAGMFFWAWFSNLDQPSIVYQGF